MSKASKGRESRAKRKLDLSQENEVDAVKKQKNTAVEITEFAS